VTRSALLAALGTATAVALALAAPAGGQTAAGDSVSGSARDCVVPASCPADPTAPALFLALGANAQSGPTGEDPGGTMTWGEPFAGGFSASDTQVSCLSVAGRVAIVGVHGSTTLTVSVGSVSVSVAGLIRVTDGGGPASGLDTFELDVRQNPPVFPPLPPLPPPTDCSSFPSGKPVLTNEEGDLTVTDVDPLPTSKDRCKHGGWRDFGGAFSSQGQCVAFVERGPRP
jgi:hypothetical protein